MLKWSQRLGKKGLTLIEVLLSVLIAVIILVGVVEAMLYLTAISSSSKSRASVFQDVQATMERIVGTSFTNLTTTFPNNTVLSSAFVTNVLRGYKLPSETITVSYPAGIGGNPIEVLVTGQWTDQGRTKNIFLRTFRRG